MGDFWMRILIILLINMAVDFVVTLIIPNAYLANIISTILISFIFVSMQVRGPGKYRSITFWKMFFTLSIFLLLFDLLFWVIL